MPQTPSFNPVNRKPRVGPLKLPKGGRQGPAPAWPIPGGAPVAVLQHWAQLWRTPHAVAWERLEYTRVVARYCLVSHLAEALDMRALAEARQLEDKLGLTPKAMRLLLWEITDDELADARNAATTDARDRIKAVG